MSLTETKILKLRPQFGNVVDWYEVTTTDSFYCLRSGLDGGYKSPWFFFCCRAGKKAKKEVIEEFNKFWENIELLG